MPHVPVGLGLFGLIQSVIAIVLAITFIWLVLKLGKLADAYTNKLKTKA